MIESGSRGTVDVERCVVQRGVKGEGACPGYSRGGGGSRKGG